MIRYAGIRLLHLVPLLFVLSLLCFGLLEAAPGDAASAQLAARSVLSPTPEQLAQARHNLGLDQPLPLRYASWLSRVCHGDLGFSTATGTPVRTELADALPWTLLLVGAALLVTTVLALLLGVSLGTARGRAGRLWPALVHGVTLLLGAAPAFVVALLGVWLLALTLGWLPSGGVASPGSDPTVPEVARHLVLPTLTLACSHHLGIFTRLIENGMLQARADQHVLTARALGLGERTVVRQHVLRVGLVPFVARVGSTCGALVGGSYVVEIIFGWPGMGRLTLEAAQGYDAPTLCGVVLLSGAVVLAVNLLADVAVAWLAPQSRPERTAARRAPRTSGKGGARLVHGR
ncbi:ABC transporter permease [Streptomyces sp. NPDC047002]|uniref:ABC transporter permease n=1 Tax=Streptomyces sp. NPDC047002 TaxID=3155475 RepID=UPI003455465D